MNLDKFSKVVTVGGKYKGLNGYAMNSKYKMWCIKHIGKAGDEWIYYTSTDSFLFTREDDAVAFRLTFGL